MLGVSAGGGRPLPPRGSGGINTGKIWLFCIEIMHFMHICIILIVIAILDAQKHETIRQHIGGGGH